MWTRMKWLRKLALALLLVMVGARSGRAVLGCLIEVEKLLPRADVVMSGRIIAVKRVVIKPCSAQSSNTIRTNPRCGELYQLEVSAAQHLRGTTPNTVTILIPWAGLSSLIEMHCDDRPPVEKMSGLYAIFFLESAEGRLWTLNGPNSIYTSQGKADSRLLQKVRDLIAR